MSILAMARPAATHGYQGTTTTGPKEMGGNPEFMVMIWSVLVILVGKVSLEIDVEVSFVVLRIPLNVDDMTKNDVYTMMVPRCRSIPSDVQVQ